MALLLFLDGNLPWFRSMPTPPRLNHFSQDRKRDFIGRDCPYIETGGSLESAEPSGVDASFHQFLAQSLGLFARADERNISRWRFERRFERRTIPLALGRDDDVTVAAIVVRRLETISEKIDFAKRGMVARRRTDDHEEAKLAGELGQCDADRRATEDDELRPWQNRFDENVHRAAAGTHVLGEFYPLARLARRDAKLSRILKIASDVDSIVMDSFAG